MIYKCLECGCYFDESELKTWYESHGEEMSGCPICSGAYKETRTCEKCGELFVPEVNEPWCHECFVDFCDYNKGKIIRNSSNKKNGTAFEKDLADKLSENGFWVHLLQQNSSGQPCDIIAVKNGVPLLIDAKDCETDKGFKLSRVEPNQEFAMTLFKETGNPNGWFALRTPDKEIYMFTLNTLTIRRDFQSYLSVEEIKEGMPLGKWLKRYE